MSPTSCPSSGLQSAALQVAAWSISVSMSFSVIFARLYLARAAKISCSELSVQNLKRSDRLFVRGSCQCFGPFPRRGDVSGPGALSRNILVSSPYRNSDQFIPIFETTACGALVFAENPERAGQFRCLHFQKKRICLAHQINECSLRAYPTIVLLQRTVSDIRLRPVSALSPARWGRTSPE